MREHSDSASRPRWFTVGVAISLSTATFATPIGNSMDQPWRRDGQPINTLRGPDTAFAVPKQPWSGAWWSTGVGSIAIRWHKALVWEGDTRRWPSLEESNTLFYEPYTADELAGMSERQLLEELSPIEKVDVVAGKTDPRKKTTREVFYHGRLHAVIDSGTSGYYPNLAGVRDLVFSTVLYHSDQLSYHGLCHGFSHAAAWLPEPDYVKVPAKLRLSDGTTKTIQVPFGSGDLKAIGTYFYGKELYGTDTSEGWKASPYQGGFVGANGGSAMNPAALHLLLLNVANEARQSFVVDIAPNDAVWNYPVVGYDITTTGHGPLRGGEDPRASKLFYVTTRVDYQRTTNPDDYAFGSFPNAVFRGQQFKQQYYRYALEVTDDDRIVGGSWVGDSAQPDFAWVLKKRIPFTGDYAFLEKYWTGVENAETSAR